MWIHVSLALLLQAAPRLEPSVGVSSRPIVAPARSANSVIEAANRAVIGFLATWRTAWHSGAYAGGSGNDETRLRDVHCHFDGSFKGEVRRSWTPTVIHNGSRRSM